MLGTLNRRRVSGSSSLEIRRSVAEDSLELNQAARILLASLAGAAGVIHLVMVPSHMGESTLEGVGFAIAGWSQLAVAVLVLVRPSRTLLQGTVVLNVLLIGAWAMSRTAGLPVGTHA